MLSVSKIAAGQEQYYLDAVASGLEDYYSGRGESSGVWTGGATQYLGLAGRVDAEDLRTVLGGRDPVTGTRLGQLRKDRVPGFDLTFSAPKSVSVLWGLGDPDAAREVRAAHDAAVDAVLGWLEREGCRSRRGVDGHETIAVDGFVAAAFVHRSSRAGDPQLHTHVLVANLAHCEDGKWRALDGKALLWQAHTAGYLYKAHLRHELTRRLGLDWGPIHKGAGEIVAIPAELCELFSTRRREIEDELAARGLHSPAAAEVAALDTRRAKDAHAEPRLRDSWAERARDARVDPTVVREALGRVRPAAVDDARRRLGITALLGDDGLTAHSSVFDRRDVLRAWCELLTHGAPVETIEGLATATARDSRVVALTDDRPYRKYSTVDLLALEHRIVDRAVANTGTDSCAISEAALRRALGARPELSPEQVAAVATLTNSGNAVDVVVAAAGTGKTFCLDAARDAWSQSGCHVIGAALAATAAAQLRTQTAIPSDTMALRLLQLGEGSLELDARTVVVVDEAAMVGTRQLAVLLDTAATARAKVVLLGDPKQLNAIHAGGLLAGLARRIPPVTLVENRRQQEAWERTAITRFRDGRIDDALALYDAHDRIVTAPTAIELRNCMVGDWHAATLGGERVVMLAERRHDVDDLNHRARQLRQATGALRGAVLEVDGRSFQPGDRVLCLRNDRRLGVHNGTLATITAVDPDRRVASIRTDDGTLHALPTRYLDAGHLTHGYAMTIHKSQGLTVDRCLVLASDTLDHNAGYTALSRGRAENRLYVHGALRDPEAHHVDRRPADAHEALAAALARDRSDRLAIDHFDPAHLRDELRVLQCERARLRHLHDGMPPDRHADIGALAEQRDQLAAEVAEHRARLDTIRPGFLHRRGHLTERLAVERRVDTAIRRLDDVERALDHARTAHHEHLEYRRAHHDGLDRLADLDARLERCLSGIVTASALEPPEHLRALGAYPTDPSNQQLWRRVATAVERYRVEREVTDPHEALGAPPDDAEGYDEWADLDRDVRWAARSLASARAVGHAEHEGGLGL